MECLNLICLMRNVLQIQYDISSSKIRSICNATILTFIADVTRVKYTRNILGERNLFFGRIPICIDTKNSFQLYNRFLSIWRAPRASYFANQPRWIKDRAQVSMEPFFNPPFQTWFFDLSIICLIVPCIFIETYKKKLHFVLLNHWKFNHACWINITIKFIEYDVNNIANIA